MHPFLRLALFAIPSLAYGFECSISAFNAILPSHATTLNATRVPPNGSFGQGNDDIAYPLNPTDLPSLCAIIVNASSSATSSFTFGLFLPDEWSERFLAVGNGGFAGGINWLAMGDGTQYGFASVSTDTGHNGTSLDMSFAYKNDEARKDWGWRALHESVVMAKSIVREYYGTAPKYSYYSGCSTGGKQGMKEAQQFPDEFDGVLAGCPSWWTSHQQTWQLEVGLINLPENTSHYIPQSQFQWISDQVLAQCDAADGIKDGIIMDPKRCDLYWEKMLCQPTSTNSSACLTPEQLHTLYQLHSPLKFDTNTWVYPNFGVGSEAQMPSSFGAVGTNAPSPYGTQYVDYMVLNNPDWNFDAFNYSVIQLADEIDPGEANADYFDLSSFYKRGSKLLTYHGYADGLIPTDASIYLYKQYLYNMTAQGIDMDSFYRFFLVPGMQHCAGSVYDAPWYFGGNGQAASLYPVRPANTIPDLNDPEHDAMLALIRWVEHGVAPEKLIATKFKNDTVEEGILRQRPICPFPQHAAYCGGPVSEASSWECTEDASRT